MKGMKWLRKRLDEIAEAPIDRQIDEIRRLKEVFPHTIEIFEEATDNTYQNCFAYALEMMSFVDRPDYTTGRPGKEFIKYLIQNSILLPSSAAEDGVIAIYSTDRAGSSITHAGKKAGDKIISKWGDGRTHVWKHSRLQLPAQYGSCIKLYSPPALTNFKRAYYSMFG